MVHKNERLLEYGADLITGQMTFTSPNQKWQRTEEFTAWYF